MKNVSVHPVLPLPVLEVGERRSPMAFERCPKRDPRFPDGQQFGQRAARLTSREMEVIGLVAAGQRNGEVAAELRISVETVKKHLSNVFQKLQIRHRVELALVAIKLGLTSDAPPAEREESVLPRIP